MLPFTIANFMHTNDKIKLLTQPVQLQQAHVCTHTHDHMLPFSIANSCTKV